MTFMKKVLPPALAIAAFGALAPSAAYAIDSESGYKDCGVYIAYARGRWIGNAVIAITPPSGTTGYYLNSSTTTYAAQTRNGGYSGNWVVTTDTSHLDFGGTYAACRNYG